MSLEKSAEKDYGLVSVIMPNYNSEKYIKETIASVLAQTYKNWELLFIDDCSTDGSLEIVSAIQDERIKILKNPKNSGAAITRNYGIDEAKGRWIAFLDSDDLWTPDKLQIQLAYMVEKNVAFSFTSYEVLHANNEQKIVFEPKKDSYSYQDILKHNHIGCLTVMYDTEKLGKVYMPVNAIKREDFACWLSILREGTKAYCVHQCLALYKIHANSVSSNKIKMVRYQWGTYRKVERLSWFQSMRYMFHWAVLGVFKYK